MERASYSGSGGSSRDVQQPWVRSSSYHHYHHRHECLSWPQRSYTCSFCKREFTSAQALGGHMNVHRRDRARLRQSPPWDPAPFYTNPNPNDSHAHVPNLNLPPPPPPPPPPSGASEAKQPSPALHKFTPLLSPLDCVPSKAMSSSTVPFLVGPFGSRGNEWKSMKAASNFEGVVEDQVGRSTGKEKKKKMATMEFVGQGVEEDLDLELRLGYT